MVLEVSRERYPEENSRAYSYWALRRNIMLLRLTPGVPLNEAELGEQLGMSRTPIREALILLRNEGLVDILPQRGSKVSRISLSHVKEGYFMRRILESAIVKELAGTLSPEQMRRIRENIDAQGEELKRSKGAVSDRFFEMDNELHRLFYQFSHRERIWISVHSLCSHYDRVRYLDTLANEIDQSQILEQHENLYYYLMMGIPAGVDMEGFYTEHLGRWLEGFRHIYTAYSGYFTDD